MRQQLLVLNVVAIGTLSARDDSFYFSPEAPVTDPFGATTAIFSPWQVIRNDAGTYTLKLSLPADTSLDGAFQMCNGNWLLSVEAPTTLGGVDFDPRDVIRY